VKTIGRRPLEPAPTESSPGKLQQITVDMDAIESNAEVAAALSNADSVFCALGTTRAVAGSAEAFKKVDYEYVAAAGRAAKKCGAPHFALVTAQGANANLWSSDWKPFHGLLYAKTKGLAENAIKEQNFSYVTIMRPGLLNRGDLDRSLEKVWGKFMSSVPVSKVAAAMIADAEKFASGGVGAGDEKVKIWSMNEICNFEG
jgi:oxidoreductase